MTQSQNNNPDINNREINRAAWRIYRLVRQKRDAQAVTELDAMGAVTVRVAHVLVLGEFRASPIVGFEWYFIGTVLVAIPLLITGLIARSFGMPGFVNGPVDQLVYYFAIFAAVFIVGSSAAGLLIEWRNRSLTERGYLHPIVRTNEIAGLSLAGIMDKSNELVGALLDAGAVEPSPSQRLRRELDRALARFLPKSNLEALQRLNSSQRRALVARLGGIAGTASPMGLTGRRAGKLDPESEYQAVMAGIAILKVYERLADESAISVVRTIADKDPSMLGEGWKQLITTSQRCLPILQELVRHARGSRELLRGSDSEFRHEEELLRSSLANGDTLSDELLRVSE